VTHLTRRTAVWIPLLLLTLVGCAAPARHVSPADPTRPGEESGFDREIVVTTATAMVGAPYRYGGASPQGFDCSGLVVYSYASAGVEGLPRSTRELMKHTDRVPLAELEPGDLLFFEVGRGKVSHVGIFVADRTFVHAPSRGKRVAMASLDQGYWKTRLERAGRLVP
jgi:cell wall-associated NlpC family hydrolase